MHLKLLTLYLINYRLGLMHSSVCFALSVVLVDCVLHAQLIDEESKFNDCITMLNYKVSILYSIIHVCCLIH